MIYQVRIEYGTMTGIARIIENDEIVTDFTFPFGSKHNVIINGQLCYGPVPVRVAQKLINHPELPEDLRNRIKVIYTAFKMEEKCTNIME